MAWRAAFVAALMVCATMPSGAEERAPLTGAVRCTFEQGGRVEQWRVELDDAVPLASVEGSDVPADYSVAHVRLRLERGGRYATIGRQTGRFLLLQGDGHPLGRGRCATFS